MFLTITNNQIKSVKATGQIRFLWQSRYNEEILVFINIAMSVRNLDSWWLALFFSFDFSWTNICPFSWFSDVISILKNMAGHQWNIPSRKVLYSINFNKLLSTGFTVHQRRKALPSHSPEINLKRKGKHNSNCKGDSGKVLCF